MFTVPAFYQKSSNHFKNKTKKKQEQKETRWASRHIKKKKLRGFSPQANYTDRAIAAGQRS
jgi:hypothetical protein